MVVDTYQKSEYKKYTHPIPNRECILSFLKTHKDLINLKKIEKKLRLLLSYSVTTGVILTL